MLAVGLIRSLFLVSDARFAYSINVHEMHQMLTELKKEMNLRFFMGYTLAWGIIATLLWYYIIFTQQYGWNVSIFWFLTGGLAFTMRFFVYDLVKCLVY